MRRLLIDTDTGSDDVWALIAALRAVDEVKVEAITVVCGNVPLDLCVKNALIAVDVAGTYAPPSTGAWPGRWCGPSSSPPTTCTARTG